MSIKNCSTAELAKTLASGDDQQVLDVREPGEFRGEHILGTRLVPLSRLDSSLEGLDKVRPTYIICRSGARATNAAARMAARGWQDLRVVEGGILAWAREGRPLNQAGRGVWSLDRQVRFTAGALVLLGTLAVVVNPVYAVLPGLVGAGLVFSGLTDTCAMGTMLARMPWNRAGERTALCDPTGD
jgi:rhodanese-related sulfurtransferase